MQLWAATVVLWLVEPSLNTPPIPAAPRLVDAVPRMEQPEILFVNFDGAVLQSGCGNDAHYDCSTLANLFDGYVGPYHGATNQRLSILQATRSALADFGVRVVANRPPDSVDYTMVLYGTLGSQDFAGIAPYIDCADLNPGDTSFTQGFSAPSTGATVILQEAAHTWGLEHVDSEADVMNPFKSPTLTQRFVDRCFRIVANTDLEPTAGTCNQIHTLFCEPGWQNSYEEMLFLFGPHVPDVQPPEITITYPREGDVFVLPAKFRVMGTVEDNQGLQPYGLRLYNHGELLLDTTAHELKLDFGNPPVGEYDVLVRMTDIEGNVGEDSVRFTVLPEGSELPEDDVSSEGGSAGCSTVPARAPTLLLLLPFVRRRRS